MTTFGYSDGTLGRRQGEAGMRHICAEIMYGWVHSDVCVDMSEEGVVSDEHKAFLHACLDEWLSKSNGAGIFYVGDVSVLVEE